jgi:short-subunit dehydrogenase involved in D-alanine esterification of teichoic acids
MKEVAVNYIAPLKIVQSFSKHKTNTAIIKIKIASIASFVNFPIWGTSLASKAAAHSLTQAQQRDFGEATLVVDV